MASHGWKRSSARRQIAMWTVRIGFLAVVLGVWQLLSGNPSKDRWALLDDLLVSKPSEIWASLVKLYQSGTMFSDVWATTEAALIGFVIGSLLGMLVGLILGVNKLLGEVFSPILIGFYSIPLLALAPLYVLWFGIGLLFQVALVVTVVFFLVFYPTFSGVQEVDRELTDVLRMMSASRSQVYRILILPSAGVWVVSSFRVAVPFAFICAIVGELISSSSGLGFLISKATGAFDTAGLFAALVLVVIVALLVNGLVTLLEQWVMRWKSESSGAH